MPPWHTRRSFRVLKSRPEAQGHPDPSIPSPTLLPLSLTFLSGGQTDSQLLLPCTSDSEPGPPLLVSQQPLQHLFTSRFDILPFLRFSYDHARRYGDSVNIFVSGFHFGHSLLRCVLFRYSLG